MAEFDEFDVFDDPRRFRDEIAELVARDPVGATMLSGVLANQIAEPAPGAGPLQVCLRNTDGPFVAALRMPGFPMLVVADPAERDLPAALRTLVDGVLELGQSVVGLHGRRDVVRQLAAAWADRSGAIPKPRMWTLLYRLGELVEPGDVRGRARSLDPGEPAEIDLLAEWFARFREETGVSRGAPVPDPDGLRRNLRRGERFTLWCLEPEPAAGAVSVPSGSRAQPLVTSRSSSKAPHRASRTAGPSTESGHQARSSRYSTASLLRPVSVAIFVSFG